MLWWDDSLHEMLLCSVHSRFDLILVRVRLHLGALSKGVDARVQALTTVFAIDIQRSVRLLA